MTGNRGGGGSDRRYIIRPHLRICGDEAATGNASGAVFAYLCVHTRLSKININASFTMQTRLGHRQTHYRPGGRIASFFREKAAGRGQFSDTGWWSVGGFRSEGAIYCVMTV